MQNQFEVTLEMHRVGFQQERSQPSPRSMTTSHDEMASKVGRINPVSVAIYLGKVEARICHGRLEWFSTPSVLLAPTRT